MLYVYTHAHIERRTRQQSRTAEPPVPYQFYVRDISHCVRDTFREGLARHGHAISCATLHPNNASTLHEPEKLQLAYPIDDNNKYGERTSSCASLLRLPTDRQVAIGTPPRPPPPLSRSPNLAPTRETSEPTTDTFAPFIESR